MSLIGNSVRHTKLIVATIHDSVEVQLAAVNALYNSLEFIKENFAREVSYACAQRMKPTLMQGPISEGRA